MTNFYRSSDEKKNQGVRMSDFYPLSPDANDKTIKNFYDKLCASALSEIRRLAFQDWPRRLMPEGKECCRWDEEDSLVPQYM